MEKENIINLLKEKPLFVGLQKEELALIIENSEIRKFQKDDIIIKEGEMERTMYVILSGSVSVFKGEIRLTNLGSDNRLTTLYKGTFFGEMSLIDMEPRSATIIANEPTELLILDFNKLLTVCSPKSSIFAVLYQNIAIMLSRRLRNTNNLLYQEKNLNIVSENKFKFSHKINDAIHNGKALLGSMNDKGEPNFMTIGWGMVGTLWNKPVISVFVRPTRYTFKNLEKNSNFVINILLSPQYQELLDYLGNISFYQENKIKEKNIPTSFTKNNLPYIKNADFVIEAKIIYKNRMEKSSIPNEILEKFYPDENNIHTLYIGEIKEIFQAN